jgi:hypothetical protein
VAEIQVVRAAFVHRRIARASAALAFAAAVVPSLVLAFLSRLGGSSGHEAFLGNAVLAALPLAAISYLAGRDLFGARGTISRDGEEVVVERPGRAEQRLPLSAVRGGVIVPERDSVLVEIELAGGDQIVAQVLDVASAEALLRELRVDANNQRCRVRVADRTAARVVSFVAPLMVGYFAAIFSATTTLRLLPGSVVLVVAAALYALLAALFQLLVATPDVVVGTDGISFRRGFRERFFSFAELEDVRMGAYGVRFVLRGRASPLLFSLTGVSNARLEALKLRIREAMHARGAAPTLTLDKLDRAGRSIAEWRASLAALARRGVDYRGTGLSAEDLDALLTSPDATPERRLAAAVALSASKHPGAPDRIRIAAAQCASERLRIALEKVGEGEEDDAAIGEALEAFAAPKQDRARR